MVTIYVIDDDEAIRGSISGFLNAHGYSVESFAKATDFLSLPPGTLKQIGVVVTDLAMPDVSGVELQERLRKLGSTLSLIVVTGVANVNATVAAMKGGAITLLEKPFSADDLIAAIELGIGRSRQLHGEWQRYESVTQRLAGMSDDERAVLEAMIVGKSIKASAIELHVSTRTVERCRKTVLEMLGVASIPELAVLINGVRRNPLQGAPDPTD